MPEGLNSLTASGIFARACQLRWYLVLLAFRGRCIANFNGHIAAFCSLSISVTRSWAPSACTSPSWTIDCKTVRW